MSDTNAGLGQKIASVGGKVAAVGAALAAIPQDEVMKKGLPAAWKALKELVVLCGLSLEHGYNRAELWTRVHARPLKKTVMLTLLLALTFILGGIEVKTRFGSGAGNVLVAVGVLTLDAVMIACWALLAGITTVVIYKVSALKKLSGIALKTGAKVASIVGVETPEVKVTGLDPATVEAIRKKVKGAFAAVILVTAAMNILMLFPSWGAVGWVVVLSSVAMVPILVTIHLGGEFGAALRVIHKIFLGVLAFLIAMFLASRLAPKSFGSMSFGKLDAWLSGLNASEWVAGILVLIPIGMLLVSVFKKDDVSKNAWRTASKYVGIFSAVLVAFLIYKGALKYKDLTGHEPPKVVEKLERKLESIGDSKGESKSASAPKGGGVYLPPPGAGTNGDTAVSASSAPAARPKARVVLPAKEEPKRYHNLTQGMDDLESLGY